VVVGSGPTAHHLALSLARSWATRGGARTGQKLVVVLVGPDLRSLSITRQRHPELDRFADVQRASDAAAAVRAGPLPDVVYVCPDDDAAAASTALQLRGVLAGRRTRIVVILEQRSGLGHLLESAPPPSGGPIMATFGLLDEACHPDVMLTGTTELLAQALHRTYLEAHADAASSSIDPALRPWNELPDSLRESNRDQAAHVAVKLAAVGRVVGPLVDWDDAQQPFAADEVEIMARLEHDRWVTERRGAGWVPGPRDPQRRTTPYLVPWEQLPEPIRDSDRMFVRELPTLLASVGLQVLRREATARSSFGDARVPDPRSESDETGRVRLP
jgi:hypothetical protein